MWVLTRNTDLLLHQVVLLNLLLIHFLSCITFKSMFPLPRLFPVPFPNLLFLHFPSEKGRPPGDINQTWHNTVRVGASPHMKAIHQEEESLKQAKKVRDSPHSHFEESHENTRLHNHNVCRGQSHRGSLTVTSVSQSPYKSCLVDSVGFFFLYIESFGSHSPSLQPSSELA